MSENKLELINQFKEIFSDLPIEVIKKLVTIYQSNKFKKEDIDAIIVDEAVLLEKNNPNKGKEVTYETTPIFFTLNNADIERVYNKYYKIHYQKEAEIVITNFIAFLKNQLNIYLVPGQNINWQDISSEIAVNCSLDDLINNFIFYNSIDFKVVYYNRQNDTYNCYGINMYPEYNKTTFTLTSIMRDKTSLKETIQNTKTTNQTRTLKLTD